uniref:hypothetical protein n=1 Tax=Nemalion vermiculare TaxID=935621 RepID=UPI00257B306D|nr:hypothetical protein QU266_pgp008 [Nemalion vermiculare]WGV34400.1 hypothetical protein [Nemalion vermiculare]
MTSKLFLYHNYDILLMSIQSLDPHALDNLACKSSNLNILEMFIFRTNSIMKYTNTSYSNKLYDAVIIAHDLSLVLSKISIQHNVNKILRDIAKQKNDDNLYSLATTNYIRRFQLNYRKSFEPYLIGQDKYRSDYWIKKISFINLFLIYKLYDQDGSYFVLFYLIYNNLKT